MTAISGFRWYRAYPSALTQLVLASGNALWTGGDPNAKYPYAALTQFQSFGSAPTTPVSFAPVRDPAANNGNGSDILIMCGLTGPYGFASGSVAVGAFATNDTFALKVVGGSTVTTSNYTVLATDNATTIAQQLVALLNASSAVTPGSPFLGQSYNVGGTIYAGALANGTAGNAITIQILRNGAGVGSPTQFTGGGASTSAPLKYDGTTLSGLSYQITRPFTGCVTWHNHVWLWGDPNAPDTLFASDIDQPEGWTFMTQNGGYDIGVGDGDPMIRAVVPIGNILYVFKTNSIYAITGYDFQSGEYQFQVQPAITGYGTPSQQCVAVLNNAVVFWSGRRFCRLRVGSFEVEHIGQTIPFTEGLVAKGNASMVRAVAGSFAVQSNLNESFATSLATTGSELYDSVALFAVDVGSGQADTVLVFDDAASAQIGNYAWSRWSGWNVGAWIPFGQGPSVGGAAVETPLLCWVNATSPSSPQIHAYGTDPMSDSGLPISWIAQTGWVTLNTGALQKQLHRLLLEMESTPGAIISFTVTPSVTADQSGSPTTYAAYQSAFAASGGVAGAEAYQTLIATLKPFLRANAYLFAFGESSATASFELTEMTLDYIEEAFQP